MRQSHSYVHPASTLATSPINRRSFLSHAVGGGLAAAIVGTGSHPLRADPKPAKQSVKLLESVKVPEKANAVQGVVTTAEHFFATNNRAGLGQIHRYDTKWKWIETVELKVDGVDHIGAMGHHNGSLWAGWLSTKKPRRSIVTEIRAKDLKILRTFEITADVTWIDPVCFDGKHVWVGDLSDLGIHRYEIKSEKLVRNAVFKYPKQMHFSQGLAVRGGRLYSIHTFGKMDGLFEFSIAEFRAGQVNQPTRYWPVAESKMHLEGFDFVPGKEDEIWHAQGSQVDRWKLGNLVAEKKTQKKKEPQ